MRKDLQKQHMTAVGKVVSRRGLSRDGAAPIRITNLLTNLLPNSLFCSRQTDTNPIVENPRIILSQRTGLGSGKRITLGNRQ